MLEQAQALTREYAMLAPGSHVLCAVSGGADSVCLLHWLRAQAVSGGFALTAAHFDHQFRGAESQRDAAFVQRLCEDWGVPCVVGAGDVSGEAVRQRTGIEETARRVYEYFSSSYNSIMSFISEHLPAHMAGDGQDPGAVLSKWLGDNFSMTRLVRAAAGVAGSLVSFFVGLVASVYLLKDKEFFLSLWQKFLFMILKQKPHGIVNEVLGEINTVLITFVKGALVDSMIVALLYSAVLSLLQVRFAVVIGLLGGILNIIPYFGPFFSMIPAFLAALATGGLAQAVFSVLALLGIQQVDSNFIYPKVVGTSIGLHPLFVLLSVSIFGYFGGVAGMLLAVPAAGIIQVLVKKWAYGR